MAAQSEFLVPLKRNLDESTDGIRSMSRQPILDLRNNVHGYELLLTGGHRPRNGSDETGASTIIDNTVLYGLNRLTCGLPAFVKCSAAMVTGNVVEMLPAGATVLEIADDLWARSDFQQMSKNLRSSGYRLALDLNSWTAGMDALLPFASYVKVDFTRMERMERRELAARLRHFAVALIAERVETQEQFRQARDDGFSLVQGYYFCRPVLLESRKIPANRLSQLEILRMLNDESIHLHRLTELVKRDASLTFRLLRLINSPVCAMQQEIHSIQAALLAVGEETFRRMANVAIASDLNAGQPSELLRMAFVRARFCELAARTHGLDSTEQYLLGLLSLLPAMLRVPMIELAPGLPLRAEIRSALLGNDIPERKLLAWLEHYESGDWTACGEVELSYSLAEQELLRSYQDAVAWTEAALYFA